MLKKLHSKESFAVGLGTSKDPSRPALKNIYLNNDGRLMATDGRSLYFVGCITSKEAEMPDLIKVFPEGDPVFTISIMDDILKGLLEFVHSAHGAKKSGKIPIYFKFYGKKEAISFGTNPNSLGQEIGGLIMPSSPNEKDES